MMAQSWEVRWKIYTLLVKVSKIRVVFGYFGGRTELYWAKQVLQTMKNVIAVPHMLQNFWIYEVLIYFCHFFWCSKKLSFFNFSVFSHWLVAVGVRGSIPTDGRLLFFFFIFKPSISIHISDVTTVVVAVVDSVVVDCKWPQSICNNFFWIKSSTCNTARSYRVKQ